MEIIETSGPVSFIVKCGDRKLIRRHQDHLRRCRDGNVLSEINQECSDVWIDVSGDKETSAEVATENATDTKFETDAQSSLLSSTACPHSPYRICFLPDRRWC